MVTTRLPPRDARSLLLLLALVPACIEMPPESSVETPADSLGADLSEVAPARYLTHLLFAGVDGTALLATFEQETDERSLIRIYDAWWAGETGWSPLVSLRDTLPAPRAAWRILPARGMDVRVGDAREVVGLAFSAPEGRVELHAGDEAGAWTGPTGQRESVGLAGLDVGEGPVGGLLFFRRAARSLQFPIGAAESRSFLLADSLGNGLLIEVDSDEGTAVAHTWMHGSIDAWDDVSFEPDSTFAETAARRWRFEIPLAGLSGTVRAIASPATGPVPAFRIECDLVADGETFRFVGLSALLRLP